MVNIHVHDDIVEINVTCGNCNTTVKTHIPAIDETEDVPCGCDDPATITASNIGRGDNIQFGVKDVYIYNGSGSYIS